MSKFKKLIDPAARTLRAVTMTFVALALTLTIVPSAALAEGEGQLYRLGGGFGSYNRHYGGHHKHHFHKKRVHRKHYKHKKHVRRQHKKQRAHYYHGRSNKRRHHNGAAIAAGVIGFAAGVIIGSEFHRNY